MPIEYLGAHILFEDPDRSATLTSIRSPRRRSEQYAGRRNGYFPGLGVLPSGDLLALFVISEAFESADATTWVARSGDLGRTWKLEGELRDLSSRKNAPPALSGRGRGVGEKAKPGVPLSDYLKPTILRDGTVIAMGYRFYRQDPAVGISIEETGGLLPGDDIISFSRDEGKTWTPHRIIARSRPELYEISGPCLELGSRDLIAVAAPFKMPDGGNPSGQVGILLRSKDKGQTWTDDEIFFRSPDGNLTPYESRVCEMQPGRLAAIVWAYDTAAARHYPNHIAVSHDDGATWARPMDTGLWGQASSLTWLGGDRLMTIHAHRGENPGIFVRVVDFSGDQWTPLEETVIYGAGSPTQTKSGQMMAEMFAALKFGQPSLLRLPDGDILACHWAVEEGEGRIRTHRLRLR
jgi:sialidase-1